MYSITRTFQVNVDIRQIICENVDWIKLARESIKWPDFMYTLIKVLASGEHSIA